MKLNTADAKLFFDLLWALQFFVNQRLGIITNINSVDEYRQRPQEDKIKVRQALFHQPDLIVAFVKENPFNLPPEELNIVNEWQYFVKEEFYIERYLKNHAIFIGKKVYGVIGLTQDIEDIIPRQRLPFMLKTILLPFKDCIVYDGLFESYNVFFGSGIKSDLKERYLKAKQQDAIIVSLGTKVASAKKESTTKSKEIVTASWSKELEALTHIASKLRGGSGQNRINGPVFSLVKASIAVANTAVDLPQDMDALYKAILKVERSLKQVEETFYRMEDGE